MNLVNYEPWGALRKMRNDINTLFGDLDDTGDIASRAPELSQGTWLPAVDIREDENAYRVSADLPGIDPKDVEVTMENNVLTIRGERKEESVDPHDYRRVERQYGAFVRRFTLPNYADPEQISAKGKNGTLEVVIAKSEKAKPKRIEVKS
ncbi:HSP20 family protein [Methylohalomonas lacus]|uniref:HSP20 family protein n=1 Tax=Methylohalomonas lacus TaxID=398773 RepID=A0AAE3L5U9_9GAMM|nr:Hsp20/alpha crystallin family protein [Methylohalomonas lacus]MCS3904062.1 HSP20 family protein [Methylohalomonas lacus]